ncbi:hypothetical protein LINPERPRIM_LOCUS5839 [Linum perenne]
MLSIGIFSTLSPTTWELTYRMVIVPLWRKFKRGEDHNKPPLSTLQRMGNWTLHFSHCSLSGWNHRTESEHASRTIHNILFGATNNAHQFGRSIQLYGANRVLPI